MSPGTTAAIPAALRLDLLQFLATARDNNALQSKAENAAVSALLSLLDLPPHHDAQKNWDSFKALLAILALTGPDARVLDVGASLSCILRWLKRLGYDDLHACDVKDSGKKYYEDLKVSFTVQDLTHTRYPDQHFDAITSISVIEHNVDLNQYLVEMKRLLRPGGLLISSTDYWSAPVDCTGIFPYGEQWGQMKVFQPDELEGFVRLAESHGFAATGPLDLSTREKAVRWERVDRDYTFAFIALRKLS